MQDKTKRKINTDTYLKMPGIVRRPNYSKHFLFRVKAYFNPSIFAVLSGLALMKREHSLLNLFRYLRIKEMQVD